jgi:hypothetical protein
MLGCKLDESPFQAECLAEDECWGRDEREVMGIGAHVGVV